MILNLCGNCPVVKLVSRIKRSRRVAISVFLSACKGLFIQTNVKTNEHEYNEDNHNDENGENDLRFQAKSFEFKVAGIFERWRVNARIRAKLNVFYF
jgi:hypothetical protein